MERPLRTNTVKTIQEFIANSVVLASGLSMKGRFAGKLAALRGVSMESKVTNLLSCKRQPATNLRLENRSARAMRFEPAVLVANRE